MTPSSSQASWDQNGITIAGWANGTDGSSLSQLNLPLAISISRNDVLYVSDKDNHRIVVVHLNSITDPFIIGSGPGTGPSEFNLPYDLVATNTSLYVIDFYNRRVQKTSLNSWNPITAFDFDISYWPYYLYVDNDDNIYLSCTLKH